MIYNRIKDLNIQFKYNPEDLYPEVQECMNRFRAGDLGIDYEDEEARLDDRIWTEEVLIHREREDEIRGHYIISKDGDFVIIRGKFEDENGNYDPNTITARVDVNPF